METSKFLAKALGIYLLIVSVGMLMNMHHFMVQVEHLIHDAPLMFVTGFFTLILGILMVLSHNIWQWHWRTLVTIVAWIMFLKGASILLFPQFIDHLSLAYMRDINCAYFAAWFDFVLGLVFCYFGFRQQA